MTEKRLRKNQSPRQYSEGEFARKRAEAKALFLAGYNPKEIDQKLSLRKGRTDQWIRHYEWLSEREKVLAQTTENRLAQLLAKQEDTFNELKLIRDKAIDSIITDEVIPVKFSEAVNAYLNTIDTERKLKTEALQISFISDIANVLREKIQDKELLIEIAEGLKEVFNKYQSSNLSSNDKIIDENG